MSGLILEMAALALMTFALAIFVSVRVLRFSLRADPLPAVLDPLDGLRRLTQGFGRHAPAVILGVILLLILLAEASVMWPVVQSPLNFWNLNV